MAEAMYARTRERKTKMINRICKIKLDDKFTLCVDRWNYWITKKTIIGEKKNKNGKVPKAENIGKESETAYVGYWNTFTDCMRAFMRKQPQYEDVKSITAMMKCEQEGQKRVAKWCADLDAALTEMQKDDRYAPLLEELSRKMKAK